MKCPKCQFDNREDAKFCKKCGTKLELRCPSCGHPYEQDSIFCDQCGDDGDLHTLQTHRSSAHDDPLTYSATGLPPNLSIGSINGTISGTVSYDAAAASPYDVQVTVDDGNGGTDSASFEWTITNTNRSPSVTNPGDQGDDEGECAGSFGALLSPPTLAGGTS